MAWIQGLVTPSQIIPTLVDAMTANGWTVVAEPGAEDVVLQTTTSPEGAIRAPKAVQAQLTGASATGSGLTGGTTYEYAVTAVGPKGESVASARATVTQTATPERVRVSWRPVDGARRYRIYRAAQGGSLERVGETDGPCNAWVDDGVDAQAGVVPPAGESLTIMARLKRTALTGIKVSMLEDFDEASGQAVNPSYEVPVDWWANVSQAQFKDSNLVYYFGSVNRNRMAIVLYGDPTYSFNDYRVAFLYLGRMVPFPEAGVDVAHNFALMGHSNFAGSTPQTYGPHTGSGVNDVIVYKTRTGVLYQAHEIALAAERAQMKLQDKGFNPSQWTEKYHLSPIYIVHGYDGYRGHLEDVLAVRNWNVVHLDEFIVSHDDGGEDRYKFFAVEPADYWPIGRASPNGSYSVAILKD